MADTQTRDFEYIDAMPGAGKTEFFVNLAVKQLKTPNAGILVYVAPTTKLLAEAFSRIAEKLQDDRLANQVMIVANPFELGSLLVKAAPTYRVIEDQPSTALNFLFGLMTFERYSKTRYKDGCHHDLKTPLRPGQVVMTTHESFVRLNRSPQQGCDFSVLERMTVIFDEARKCVLHSQELRVPREQWQAMWGSLETSPVEDLRERKGKYRLYEVEKMLPLREVCKLHGLTMSRKALLPDHVKGMLRLFNKYTKTGRGGLYVLSSADPATAHLDLQMADKISIQVVMRPTSLFENYKRVILTSAFFRDSQMYHFLKKDGHRLRSLLQGDVKGPLKLIRDRGEALRHAAGQRLQVATLIRSEFYGANPAYQNVLSSNLLDKGMLLPIEIANEASGNIRNDLTVDEVIRNLNRDDGQQVSTVKGLHNRMRRWAVPPLWVLLDRAAVIFENWRVDSKEPGRSLLALNVASYRRWAPSSVRYLRMVRFILAHGSVELKGDRSESDLHDGEHDLDAKLVPPMWRARLHDILYSKSANSLFTVPRTPFLHGINRYKHLNAFTHLAALNPGPSLISVYQILIPKYNIDQDHSIENLVQTLYRTSLRELGATEPVLMIIPFEASADLLAEKIGVKSFKVYEEPYFAIFHHFKSERTDSQRERHLQATKDANQRFDPRYKDELQRARNRASSARSSYLKNPESEKLKATWERHEAALARLKVKAALNGK